MNKFAERPALNHDQSYMHRDDPLKRNHLKLSASIRVTNTPSRLATLVDAERRISAMDRPRDDMAGPSGSSLASYSNSCLKLTFV